MKRHLFFSIGLAFLSMASFAQTPRAPAQPSGTISGFSSGAASGFAPNPVSGFTPNAVSGFAPNAASGFNSAPVNGFTRNPVSTSNGGVGGTSINTAPVNPNVIFVPPPSFQPGEVTVPANGTNRVLLTPLF